MKSKQSNVDSINDAVTVISKITTDQNASANQISSNVSQTTTETRNVTDSIAQIADSAKEIAQGGRQTATNAESLHSSMEVFTEEALNSSKNAQDTKSASSEVRTISRRLSKAIGQYKTEGNGGDDDEM